jgi:hypothetical protein
MENDRSAKTATIEGIGGRCLFIGMSWTLRFESVFGLSGGC